MSSDDQRRPSQVYYIPSTSRLTEAAPSYCCTICGCFVSLHYWDSHLAHHRLINRMKEVAIDLWRVVRPDKTDVTTETNGSPDVE